MLELSPTQRRELRARAHALHPVVSIAGKGLSAAVLKEIELSLKAHELIKVRVYGDDREQRAVIYAELCQTLACAPVQHIGKLLVVYRPNPETVDEKSTSARRSSPSNASHKPTKSSARVTSKKIATSRALTHIGKTAKPVRSSTGNNRSNTVRSLKRSSKD